MRSIKKGLLSAKNGASSLVRLIDIGCGAMPYRRFFPDSEYIGIDEYTNLPEVKKINIENPFMEGDADFIICSEVLEHSFNFRQVIKNIFDNMKPGATAFVSVPFAYEVHGWDYHDYFRYTEEALSKLFSEFSSCEIVATTTYPTTLIQKINNLIYYIPLPYILKVPFFVLNNLCIIIAEGIIRLFLRFLRIGPKDFISKLIFSYPVNYICILKK
jgi:SAM-dependent methyltransferase